MYSETDKHCIECACTDCDLRATARCIDGVGMCDECDNAVHCVYCPWMPGERQTNEHKPND